MKILYFSRDYTTHDHRFLSFLANTEHEVGYLRFERCGHSLEDRSLPTGIQHIHWVGDQGKSGWKQGLLKLASLRKIIRSFKPDIIQAGPIQRSAFLVALAGFHPLVTLSWGYDLLVDVNKNRIWEWITRFTLKRSDALVGDCNTIRNLAVTYGMAEERIVTFPWGANIQKYSPVTDKSQTGLRKRLGWGQDTFVLLSTRTWSDIYGVEDLARAYVKAVQGHPELRMFMLGNGPLASKIHKVLAQGNALDTVHFPGQVAQDKIPEYYRSADLYISTSHSDGTSISLLEALASGTPVLLTDIPGNLEWITNSGEVGWTYRDGDIGSLVTGIQNALNRSECLPQMSQNARKLAKSRGDWNRNALKLLEAYKIAIG